MNDKDRRQEQELDPDRHTIAEAAGPAPGDARPKGAADPGSTVERDADRKEVPAVPAGEKQGGFRANEPAEGNGGRQPPRERDRDYDPDGDRTGRSGDRAITRL
jgi:hypothetical protein